VTHTKNSVWAEVLLGFDLESEAIIIIHAEGVAAGAK
jgi:hypothetical protein